MMGEEELMFQLKYAFLLTLHRKMWELEHRASLAQIHAQILSSLVENFPTYEDEKTQQRIRAKRIYELDSIYNRLQCQYGLFCEYFPDTSYMWDHLIYRDFKTVPTLDRILYCGAQARHQSQTITTLKTPTI
jgi:hypothetical protein